MEENELKEVELSEHELRCALKVLSTLKVVLAERVKTKGDSLATDVMRVGLDGLLVVVRQLVQGIEEEKKRN